MKPPLFLLAFVAVLHLSSCASREVERTNVNLGQNAVVQDSQSPIPASTQPKDGLYPGKGKVTKINNELKSVELDHEEIVGVMPPMIMEFYVHEKWLLTGLKVGDNVEFVLKYEHPAETIVSIKKIK
ncbi:MAG: copper-binding protein [Chloracidobacterium sp.]|nr:copper-binding protein [Chloracidobacterium sp.]